LNNNTAAHRKNNGCADTEDNKTDFFELAPSPRNNTAPPHTCGTSIFISNIAPLPFCVNATSGTMAAVSYNITGNLPSSLNFYLSDATGSFGKEQLVGTTSVNGATGSVNINVPLGLASSLQYRLRAYAENTYGEVSSALEIINGAKNVVSANAYADQNDASVQWTLPSGCFDNIIVVCKQGSSISGKPSGNGTDFIADPNFAGGGTAFGGGKVVYKGVTANAIVTGLVLGQTYYFKVFTNRGADWSAGVETSATTHVIPAPGEVVINAFSTRYFNAAGEYYELVNKTGKAFDLADISFIYQDNKGSGRPPTLPIGILQPYSFWLLSRPDSTTVTVGKTFQLKTDGSSGAGVADAGYIGLVRKKDNGILDAVGFGAVTGGTMIEGTAADPVPGGAGGGIRRKKDGVDNNNNKTDFEVIPLSAIDLRNSASRLALSGAAIPPGTYSRMYVTGNSNIAGNIILSEKLVLAEGKLALANSDLSIAAAEGGSANSYVQTNGSGTLAVNSIGTNPFLFPVGNSTYNPVTIETGSGLRWQVKVDDSVAALGGDRAVRRTWHITPSAQPTAGATLTFQYNEGDRAQLGANFSSVEGVQVWQWHNGNWQKAGPVTQPTGPAGGIRTVTLDNWSQFSPFVIASASAMLPVRFGAMQLYEREHHRILEFTAHNELDIVQYDIEWSGNGIGFVTIGTIQPANNRGGTETYTFEDNRPAAGVGYYRVKAVEQDGNLLYSPVLQIMSGTGTTQLRIAPTPVQGGIINYNIGELRAGTYQVQVLDIAGRQVWWRQLAHSGGMAVGTIALPQLQPGVYLLTVHGPIRLQKAFIAQ
jgi:hypothetical protein